MLMFKGNEMGKKKVQIHMWKVWKCLLAGLLFQKMKEGIPKWVRTGKSWFYKLQATSKVMQVFWGWKQNIIWLSLVLEYSGAPIK